MGNSSSKDGGGAAQKVNYFTNGVFSSPVFWQDDVGVKYSRDTIPTDFNKGNRVPHSSSELAFLLLGCYEQLSNIPMILENVINADNPNNENEIILELCKNFAYYSRSAQMRENILIAQKNFYQRIFTPFKFLTPASYKESDIPTFTTVLDALKATIDLAKGGNPALTNIKKVGNYFREVTPSSACPPPTPDFMPRRPGHTEFFLARFVMGHGVASNGHYLFVLCADDTINIFPLFNAGSISTPMARKFQADVKFDQGASLVASSQFVTIFQEKDSYRFSIEDLLNKDPAVGTKLPKQKNDKDVLAVLSDGLTMAKVEYDFTVHVYKVENQEKIRTINLKQGHAKLHTAVPVLFPTTDYHIIPMQISGNYLCIVFRIAQATCIFRVFSLVTGMHIHDEPFQCPEQMYATSLDAFNQCHWAVVLMDSNRLGVRRFYFAGSHDPLLLGLQHYTTDIKPSKVTKENAFKFMAGTISPVVSHLAGSQVVPPIVIADKADQLNSLLDLILSLINLSSKEGIPIKNAYVPMLQTLVIVCEINVKLLENSKSYRSSVVEKLYNIVTALPVNLGSFLFFSHVQYMMRMMTTFSISVMVGLLDRLDSEAQVHWALRCLELSTVLAHIPVSGSNALINLIPTSPLDPPMKPVLESLLLIHQRALISYTNNALKQDPFLQISFTAKKSPSNSTPIDNFGQYTNLIITKFDNAVSQAKSLSELQSSFIFNLFGNFLRAISVLSEWHTVAQQCTALFNVLLIKITDFVTRANVSLNADSPFSDLILTFLFIYAKFAATLVKGGGLTVFEERFIWLVKANLNMVEDEEKFNKIDSTDLDVGDSRLNSFLNNVNNPMDALYKKYKAPLNRNLKPVNMELDRIFIAAFAKHSGCLEELLNYSMTKQPSDTLKKGLDQMIKIRNVCRQHIQQNKEAENIPIRTRGLMLIRMDAQFEETSDPIARMADFITCETLPADIKRIIRYQKIRIQTTLVGFMLIEGTYKMNVHALFNEIISYALSRIDRFEGLSSIIKIANLTNAQKDQFMQFFKRVMPIIKSDPKSDRLVLVVYRFFRDVNMLNDIKTYCLEQAIEAFDDQSKRYSIFALAFSLISASQTIPESLVRFEKIPPIKYIMLSETLAYLPCTEEIFDSFDEVFWNVNPDLARLTCRVMYRILASTKISRSKIKSTLIKMVKKVGRCHMDYCSMPLASEIIWILRRMINEEHPAAQLLIKIILNVDRSDSHYVTGVFALLGGYMESIRPYCNLRYHANRNSAVEYIAIPQNKSSVFICFERPFNIFKPSIKKEVRGDTMAYAVPVCVIDPVKFGNYDFILSFFDSVFKGSSMVSLAMYMQVLALFSKDKNFVSLFEKNHMKEISKCPLAFSDIYLTMNEIKRFATMKSLPEISGFSQITFQKNVYASYLSPVIDPEAPKFKMMIKFEKGQMDAYVGITTSNVDKINTRYALIHIPSCTTYPIPMRTRVMHLHPDATVVSFTIDIQNREISLGDNAMTILFPAGQSFRIIIAQKRDIPLRVEIPLAASSFLSKPIPPQQSHGCIDFEEAMPLYAIPGWVAKNTDLAADVGFYPKINSLKAGRLTAEDKMMMNFLYPPKYISIHPGFATEASAKIVSEQLRGLFKQLAMQWSTVILMRVTIARAELIDSDKLRMKIFSLLVVMLESFVPSYFEEKKFPFSLDEPIWVRGAHTNLLYLAMESECMEALRVFIKQPEFVQALKKGLQGMCRSEKLHLICRPSSYHYFYQVGAIPSKWCLEQSNCILAPNDFDGIIENAVTVYKVDGKHRQAIHLQMPMIITRGPNNFEMSPQALQHEISVLKVSAMNNTWVYDTAFELLLLLKNFVYIANSQEFRTVAKKILLDCYMVSSPFVYPYLPQFADLMQVQAPATPLDNDMEYKRALMMVGSVLRQRSDEVSQRFFIFYVHEQRILTSNDCKSLVAYFPEFFATPPPKPASNMISIPPAIIDPGAIKSGIASHILMIRQFMRQYKSLVGFPFWEILPMWYRVSGAWRGTTDFIDPVMKMTSNTEIHISNPSKLKCEVKFTPRNRISRDTILLMSSNAQFENPRFIPPADFRKGIVTTKEDIFFSLVGEPGGWQAVSPSFKCLSSKPKNASNQRSDEIDVETIRSKFVEDMQQFAIAWSQNHTEELLNQLPRFSLREPTNSMIENIAKGSYLCTQFSPTVVVLRALLLHHFNYIRYKYYEKVPQSLWDSMARFVSTEDAEDTLMRSVAISPDNIYPEFTIDRHSAHRLIVNGQGDPSRTIIHQLALIFMQLAPQKERLRCRKRPWKVHFVGESAIDAGGPARELLTEAAASIFEPTSMLALPVPNARTHTGRFADTFIPFDAYGQRRIDYRAIGTLIGIVVRTGFSQDFPFAPLVWRFLSGERLGVEDVVEIDSGLGSHFEHMREVKGEPEFKSRYAFPWTYEAWDGSVQPLPGHTAESLVGADEVEQYIKEAVDARLDAITPLLKEIRFAFRENIGFKHNQMLTGALLSRMVQGNGVISVEHLKNITVIYDFEGGNDSPYIQRFWRCVERMSPENRKLLLKFITTLTRLPNSSINPDFRIKIDRHPAKNPDEVLPTASTCFNKLHLPAYSDDNNCYNKLLTAVQFCQTMENQ